MNFNPGGLMRCCVQTLEELEAAGELEALEQTKCRYCNNPMEKQNGTWHWSGVNDL